MLRSALSEWDAELARAHQRGRAELAARVGARLGLDEDDIERVAIAADLHDIGKIAIPRAILHKPGPLDDDEWDSCAATRSSASASCSAAPALVGVAELIRSSHERWDGAGYPDALAGDDIPLGSQIVFVCDAFSAMTSERPYRPRSGTRASPRRAAPPRRHPVRARSGGAFRAARLALCPRS